MPISRAISLSCGARPSCCCSLCSAVSMSRCCLRLPRLIQSAPRSSSSIAPRIRWVAKVSNCTPCSLSKRVIASARPIMPTWIRSSTSTLAGSLAIIWCARRRTSGLYCLSIAFVSRRPVAVYMGAAPSVCGSDRFIGSGAAAQPVAGGRRLVQAARCVERSRPGPRSCSRSRAAAAHRPVARAPAVAVPAWVRPVAASRGSTATQSCSTAPRNSSAQRATRSATSAARRDPGTALISRSCAFRPARAASSLIAA